MSMRPASPVGICGECGKDRLKWHCVVTNKRCLWVRCVACKAVGDGKGKFVPGIQGQPKA